MSEKRNKALRKVAREIAKTVKAKSSHIVLRNRTGIKVEIDPETGEELRLRIKLPGTLLNNPDSERGIYIGLKRLKANHK